MSVERVRPERRAYLAIATAVVGIAAAVVAVFGAIAPANAAPVSFAFHFGTVQPGEAHSDVDTLTLPVDTIVSGVERTSQISPESGVFQVELCSTNPECIAVEDLPGTRLSAGDYTLRVRLEVADTVDPGAYLSTAGRISFTEEMSGLAATGSNGWGIAGWIAGALLIGGVAIWALGSITRRKKDDS